MALNYALRLKNNASNDREIELIFNDLMKEMVFHHSQNIHEFYTKPQKISENNTKEMLIDSVEYSKLSKYEKIEYQKKFKESKKDENPSFYKSAFIGLINEEFIQSFENALKLFKQKEKEDNLTASELSEKKRKEKKEKN